MPPEVRLDEVVGEIQVAHDKMQRLDVILLGGLTRGLLILVSTHFGGLKEALKMFYKDKNIPTMTAQRRL